MPALLAEIPAKFCRRRAGFAVVHVERCIRSPINVAYLQRNSVFYFAKVTPAAELKRMKIYFNVGNNDDYGFEQGAEKLHQLLDSRGVANEFHVYPGRHDPQFAVRYFGEVVQFQWNAIGK